MTKRSPSSPIPWKALILGGVIGYLVAVLSVTSNSGGGGNLERFLAHGGEAALESEHEAAETHHGEEEEEEENEAAVLDATIAVIVLFLVVLTILFEIVKESVEETAESAMEPVIEGLFGELTVLGFLSVITFVITKAGWFDDINSHFFEEKDELLEVFESVHYMLFFIMVFFVFNVLILMFGGKQMSRNWWMYNRACRDKEYMAQLDAVLTEDDYKQPSYCQFFLQQLFPRRSATKRFRSELQLFRGLRDEFVEERSFSPPFNSDDSNQVDPDFMFGRYLSICQAHNLAHMVHLSNYTWVFMAVVTAVFYGVAILVDSQVEPFAWIWAATGWLFFALGTYFDFHMVQLISWMVCPKTSHAGQGGEDSALLASASLPKWTTIDVEKYMQERPMMARMFVPTKSHPTRQDTLYWCERKGPKVYTILFQIQMLFTAAYVSLLLLTLLPFMLWRSEQTEIERVGFLIVSLLPVYLLLSKYQAAAANLTIACSVGVHRRPQTIAQVNRMLKTEDMIQRVILLQKLQWAAKDGFTSPTVSPSSVTLSSGEMEDVLKEFDAMDESGDGSISSEELGKVLEAHGVLVVQDTLAAMMKALDTDGNGTISKQEYIDFYKLHVVIELDDDGLHELGKQIFAQIDLDGSGELTLGEFKSVLDAYNVGMTVDEIGEIVKELDEKDDGTISEHEFVRLLTVNHKQLFDRTPLPKLE